MRLAFLLAAAVLVLAGCASGGGSSASGASEEAAGGATWNEGTPVRGNWSISWKNLDPKYQANTISIVNASSEIGQKLLSGKATSTEVRVATDEQMGAILAQLKRLGFDANATSGISLENVPQVPNPKGIIVVTEGDRPRGLLMQLGLGKGPVPEAYTNCKRVVVTAHMNLQGYDARASLGAPDETIFSAPKPTFRRP